MNGINDRHLQSIDQTLRFSAIGLFLIIFIWLLTDMLLIVFSAVLMACVLRGASGVVRRWSGLGPQTALLAVVTLTTVSLAALMWWRGNIIANQANEIMEQLGVQLLRLWEQLQASSWGQVLGKQISATAKLARAGLTGYVPGVVGSVFGAGGSLVVIAVTAVFLAASPRLYLNGSLRLLPRSWRPRGREVAFRMSTTLQLWFLGQLADMIVVAMLVGIGLTLLGVPLAPTLALLAGLLNFIPYVGALAGAVPAVLVALAQSPTLAMWVALMFFCIQILEGNLIAPLIQRKTISLAPALTIVAQTILGALFGIFGLIIATPLTAAAVVAVHMVYIESFLESDESGASVGRAMI